MKNAYYVKTHAQDLWLLEESLMPYRKHPLLIQYETPCREFARLFWSRPAEHPSHYS